MGKKLYHLFAILRGARIFGISLNISQNKLCIILNDTLRIKNFGLISDKLKRNFAEN